MTAKDEQGKCGVITVEYTLEIYFIEDVLGGQKFSVGIEFVFEDIFDFIDASIGDNSVNCAVILECNLVEVEKIVPFCDIAMGICGVPDINSRPIQVHAPRAAQQSPFRLYRSNLRTQP